MSKNATCHSNKPVKAVGLCRNCYDKLLRDRNPEYKARQQANARKWAKEHPERTKEIQRKKNEKYKNSPEIQERIYLTHVLREYELTEDQYRKLLTTSDNKCMICKNPSATGKRLHIDHCHKTNVVRGLLCNNCNWYMGKIDKDPELLERLINYSKNKK